MEEASAIYEGNLRDTPAVHAYLTTRGITGVSAQYFRLGYVAEPWIGHDEYEGRLSIPYLTPTGIVGMKFRAIPELTERQKPKYTGLHGIPPRLYNAHAVLDQAGDTAVIVEGEFDAIMVQQITGLPSVGVPGVDSWKPYMARVFAGMTVIMIPDADPPNAQTGDRPGEKLVAKIADSIPGLTVIRLPEPNDVTSFVVQEGPEALLERIGL